MPDQTSVSVPQLQTQMTRGMIAIVAGVVGGAVIGFIERDSTSTMLMIFAIGAALAVVGLIAVLDVRGKLSFIKDGTPCVGKLTKEPTHANAGSTSFLDMHVQYPDGNGKTYEGKARLYLKGRYPAMSADSEVPVFFKPNSPGSFAIYVADCGIAKGSASPV
jgi:hypothetical protein